MRLALLVLAGLGAPTEADEVVRLSTWDGSRLLPFLWHEDRGGTERPTEVLESGRFQPFSSRIGNLGRSRSAIWIRVDLDNDTERSARRLLLLGWPRLEDVRAWTVIGGAVAPLGRSGWRVPWALRAYPDPSHPFFVEVPATTRATVLLRVQGPGEMLFPGLLLDAEELAQLERSRGFIIGTYLGLMLGLTGYNLLVFFRVRQREHLLYAASVLCFLPWWLLNSGWLGAFPAAAEHAEVITSVLAGGWHFFRLAFCRVFLRLGAVAPRLDRAVALVQWVGVPLAFSLGTGLFGPTDREVLFSFLDIPLASLSVLSGVLALRGGVVIARWFLPASGLLLLGLLLGHVIFSGVVLHPMFAGASILLGMLAELVVLTLALAEAARTAASERAQLLREAASRRLAALEGLVAGVTHELGSPLGALRSSLDSVDRAVRRLAEDPDPERARRAALAVKAAWPSGRAASDRIEEVVRSLGHFARLDAARIERVDPAEGLRSALSLLRSKVPPSVAVEVEVPSLAPIRCRPADLNQAYMALLDNALEAMPDGGRLRVVASEAGGQVVIVVEDTGRGIPLSERARLFEPRLVRRGRRVKMGFGLSLVRAAVDEHGGTVEVVSEEGRGTAVTLRLPRNPRDLDGASQGADLARPSS